MPREGWNKAPLATYKLHKLESATNILILFGFLPRSTFVGHMNARFRSKVGGNPSTIAIFGIGSNQFAELAGLGI